MKILQILSNPLAQIISFCIILVGSANFGGPYGFFLYRAGQEGYLFAIIGIAGIIITLISLFLQERSKLTLQFSGALLMIISLLVFFFSSQHFMNMYAFKDVLPLLTLFLFIAIIVLVTRQFFKMFN